MRSLIALVLFTSLTGTASAQYRQNFGLVRHQPDSTLPRGKAPFDIPVRKAKASASTAPTAIGTGEYLLNRGWEMADALARTILPGLFSDGYFTLMPGEKRELTVDVPADAKGMQVITEAYNSAAKTHRL